MNVVTCSDIESGWTWIERHVDPARPIDWRYVSTRDPLPLIGRPGPRIGRLATALRIRQRTRGRRTDMVVSHGPLVTTYVSLLSLAGRRALPHIAASFNFTDLPTGRRLETMRRTLAHVDRFLVFSRMERDLYAKLFDLPADRFHFSHWGVEPPITEPLPKTIPGRYVAAIGGEARDYAVLTAAARRLPSVPFVVVARPHSFAGIDLPPNVQLLVNRPWEETWSIVAHAAASVVPLRSRETPNGHVTIVGGAYLGKAQVITDSTGIHDYAEHEVTALLAPPGDDAAFAAAIERLLDEPELAAAIGGRARTFAETYCNEIRFAHFAEGQIREVAAAHGLRA